MENRKINLIIVSDNALVVNGLKHYLIKRFGNWINIMGFYDRKSCLKNIDGYTGVVVLDHFISGKPGIETLKRIKVLSPATEIIMHSSNEEVAELVHAFKHRLQNNGDRIHRFDLQFS